MLVELRIRDFALIEEAALDFGSGLNVLTGETGAGKTIILSALGLLLGGRASAELVRSEAREAIIEGLFELDGETASPFSDLRSVDSADQSELLLKRIIAEGGRSRVMVDGELATVQNLSRIGTALVQIYGQHEQQSLLRAESHETILDRYAGLEPRLTRYRDVYERAHDVSARLEKLARLERERANLIELARFRVAELERAELVEGEDDELSGERAILANAARLSAAAQESEEMLYGGEAAAVDIIARAEAQLAEAAELDKALAEPLEMLRAARANLEEAARTLGAYAGRIEADPARLEQVEERIQELSRIKRKYGGTIEEASRTLEASRAELAEIEGVEESKAELEAELARTLDELAAAARELSAARTAGASELKRKMESELHTLGMRSAVFETRLATLAAGNGGFNADGIVLGPFGMDAVEFHLSPNLGQPPMALARIASGGELSRVMLALKRLEAQRRGIATMIFDEVDAGIGGEIAQIVGRKLKELSRYHQILCVTHLPQIAAFADRHFLVEKQERRGSTRSRVRPLDGAERVEEIARMLAGAEITDKFRRAAKEMLGRASGK